MERGIALIHTVRILALLFFTLSACAPSLCAEPVGQRAEEQPRPSFGAGVLRLGKAWSAYEARRYEEAAALFEGLVKSSHAPTANNARLGLAYSRIKQERYEEAVPILERLVHERYRTEETMPALLEACLGSGDYERLERYLSVLPAGKALWEKRIAELKLRVAFGRVDQKNASQLRGFLSAHPEEFKSCLAADVFLKAADGLKGAAPQEARPVYRHLLTCTEEEGRRLELIQGLAATDDPERVLALIEEEKMRDGVSAAGRQTLARLSVELQRRRLAALKPPSPAGARIAEDVLTVVPADAETMAWLGWNHYSLKEYDWALAYFGPLARSHPENRGYCLGLAYSLEALHRPDEALEVLSRALLREDPEATALARRIHHEKALAAFRTGDYATAEAEIALMATSPDNTDATLLLARVRMAQKRPIEARSLVAPLARTSGDPDVARIALAIYAAAGDRQDAWEQAARMAASSDPALRKPAADFFHAENAPVLAGQTFDDPTACYFRAETSSQWASPKFRHKTGSRGLGRLEELELPFTLSVPRPQGQVWSFSVTPVYLSAGSAYPIPNAGRYYEYLNGGTKVRRPEESLWGVVPELAFEKEGLVSFRASLGSTPVSGPVTPMVTFATGVRTARWLLSVTQSAVTQSMTSYVGNKDPYSHREWGRVLATGAEGEYTWTPAPSWWISADGGGHYYWGQDVWSNWSAEASLRAGRWFYTPLGNVSLGGFVTGRHFERNTNFYTYGHGGYYSPQAYFMAGPSVRFKSEICRSWWVDTSLSTGYLYARAEGSPRYPLFKGPVNGLTAAARADVIGTYDSDRQSKIGVDWWLDALKLITPHVAAGFTGRLNTSAGYTEWRAGVTLLYFFEPRSVLDRKENLDPPRSFFQGGRH